MPILVAMRSKVFLTVFMITMVIAHNTPKKCCEKRCEMNGKKGESGGNDEELRGFYLL